MHVAYSGLKKRRKKRHLLLIRRVSNILKTVITLITDGGRSTDFRGKTGGVGVGAKNRRKKELDRDLVND